MDFIRGYLYCCAVIGLLCFCFPQPQPTEQSVSEASGEVDKNVSSGFSAQEDVENPEEDTPPSTEMFYGD